MSLAGEMKGHSLKVNRLGRDLLIRRNLETFDTEPPSYVAGQKATLVCHGDGPYRILAAKDE